MTIWTKVKWGLRLLGVLLVAAFLHYMLPQHDIVRITGTEIIRTDFTWFNRMFYASPDAGTPEGSTRDVRYIYAAYPNGESMEYRNEDTGWIWPPYFKFDSARLQNQSGDLKSTPEAPKWVVITHYGWRWPFTSLYPNAVSLRMASGPDERIFPWVSVLVLAFLAGLTYLLWRMWAQFRERTLDPIFAGAGDAIDKADATADAARAKVGGVFARFGRWLNTWRSRK